MIRSFRKLKSYCHGRIIDLGSGPSPYYEIISSPDTSYVAMDRITELPRPETRNISRFSGDLYSLPLHDQTVDTVFCSQVLSQIPDPDRAIQEMARVLRPRGSLIISVPSNSPILCEPADYYRFTPEAIKTIVERKGLKSREVHIQGQLFASFALNFAMNLVLSRMTPGKEMKLKKTNQLIFAPVIALVNISAAILDRLIPFNRTPVNFILVATKD
jgi:SAM-dependent methyltransferase